MRYIKCFKRGEAWAKDVKIYIKASQIESVEESKADPTKSVITTKSGMAITVLQRTKSIIVWLNQFYD
jgi:hypothetical protein